MKCKVCLSKNLKLLFDAPNVHGRHIWGNERFSIYECCDCSTAFTAVNPDSEFYEKYYPQEYYPQTQYPSLVNKILLFLQNLSFSRRVDLIKKYCPKAKNILEIGCARGEFLQYLPSSFKKSGIEINPQGYNHIKQNYPDINIYNIHLDNPDTQTKEYGSYDVIIMWHVLEHVQNPDIFIANIRKLLVKDGLFIFEIPNRNSFGFRLLKQRWFHLDTPRHLFHYNYASIQKLTQKHNLQIVGFKGDFCDYFQDLASSFYALAENRNLFFKMITMLVVIPFSLVIRLIVALFIPHLSEVNIYVVKHVS